MAITLPSDELLTADDLLEVENRLKELEDRIPDDDVDLDELQRRVSDLENANEDRERDTDDDDAVTPETINGLREDIEALRTESRRAVNAFEALRAALALFMERA